MSDSRERLGPVGLVVTSVTSVQFGAALAATLFPLVGPLAVVALRSVTSAAALVATGRGARPASWRQVRVPLALGAVLAGMNTCVYAAVDRLPLGVVITLEFLGPLGVALAASRRRTDLLPALAAGIGVALLTLPSGAGPDGRGLDLAGVAFALLGGVGWALYILLNRELGRQPDGSGLALASVFAAALVTPIAVAEAGRALLQPHVLALGVAIGLLSSALPYSLDRLALKRLRPGPFGVLMSLNPAVATLAGLVVLHQQPVPEQLAGTALIAMASAVAARTSPVTPG